MIVERNYAMKAVLSLTTAMVMSIIVLNNVQDRKNGLTYTAHALNMTYVPDGPLHYRSISDRRYVIGMYTIVVVWEALIAVLCALGAALMHKRIGLMLSKLGHVLGALLFFGAFRGIAGQWFLMWQSGSFNGLPDAHRMLQWMLAMLVLLHMRDEQ